MLRPVVLVALMPMFWLDGCLALNKSEDKGGEFKLRDIVNALEQKNAFEQLALKASDSFRKHERRNLSNVFNDQEYNLNEQGTSLRGLKSIKKTSKGSKKKGKKDQNKVCEKKLETCMAEKETLVVERDTPRYLFVQMANNCILQRSSTGNRYFLSTSEVDDDTYAFTDRPFRGEDVWETSTFIKNFDSMFGDSYPNAAVTFNSVSDTRFEGPLVSAFIDAVQEEDNTVKYELEQSKEQNDVISLDSYFHDGEDSAAFSHCSIFIDDVTTENVDPNELERHFTQLREDIKGVKEQSTGVENAANAYENADQTVTDTIALIKKCKNGPSPDCNGPAVSKGIGTVLSDVALLIAPFAPEGTIFLGLIGTVAKIFGSFGKSGGQHHSGLTIKDIEAAVKNVMSEEKTQGDLNVLEEMNQTLEGYIKHYRSRAKTINPEDNDIERTINVWYNVNFGTAHQDAINQLGRIKNDINSQLCSGHQSGSALHELLKDNSEWKKKGWLTECRDTYSTGHCTGTNRLQENNLEDCKKMADYGMVKWEEMSRYASNLVDLHINLILWISEAWNIVKLCENCITIHEEVKATLSAFNSMMGYLDKKIKPICKTFSMGSKDDTFKGYCSSLYSGVCDRSDTFDPEKQKCDYYSCNKQKCDAASCNSQYIVIAKQDHLPDRKVPSGATLMESFEGSSDARPVKRFCEDVLGDRSGHGYEFWGWVMDGYITTEKNCWPAANDVIYNRVVGNTYFLGVNNYCIKDSGGCYNHLSNPREAFGCGLN